MKEITNNTELQEIIANGKPILLDFYADWCGPCQTLLPVVDKLADKYKDDFNIVKVNVDKFGALAEKLAVRSIPSLFFIEKGIVQEKLVGVQSITTLESKIKSYSKAKSLVK